jgi:glycogen debranching enzyme
MKGYRFVATKGKLSHVNGNRPELCHKRIQIDPGVDGSHWELLICEVDVDSRPEQETMDTCAPLVQQALCASFGDAVSAFGSVFDDYCRQITPWSSGSPGDTEILAAYVMWTSTVRAGGHFTRESILMSKLWMNKIWSWDNCINALGVACLDIDLAVGQLMALYDHQAPDGRIPDSVDWLLVEWGFTKPPIHGWTLKKLLEDRVDIKPDDLKRLYHHTAKFTNFWLRERQTDVSKLPWYSHGNDSGWDNSTVFDNQSVVCGPDCAAFLILQCDLLAQLSQQLGDGTSETQMWTNAKESLVKALLEELWDGESFRFKDAITGETRKSSSLLRLVPLIASKYLPEIVVSKMADEISKHLTEWGLATEELDSQFYESDGYWRGPIWAPPTVLIESGLREGGFTKLADVISERYINLCEKSGFAENYDAVTGAGLRDLSYTWSASAYLHLKKELSVRNGLET